MRRAGGASLLASAAVLWGLPAFVPPGRLQGSHRDLHVVDFRSIDAQGSRLVANADNQSTEGISSSYSAGSCRLAAAALCVLGASVTHHAAAKKKQEEKKRLEVVTRHWYPSACGAPKQKVIRRLEPWGPVPSWSTKPLYRRRVITPWRKHKTPRPSWYMRQLLEKQRLRYHYNIKEKQMQVYMREAWKKGHVSAVEAFQQMLESRLDNTVWRLGLAPTMAAARRFVRQGHMQLITGQNQKEWRTVNIPSIRLKIGDQIRVSDREGSKNMVEHYKTQNQEYVEPPAHIRWSKENMEGEYLDLCSVNDFGIPIDPKFIQLWYSGQGGARRAALRRRHIRWFEGTTNVIKKNYNGGRVRPTPENLINIKLGIGLNKRGRKRPPCLWGRRRPLNNPYSSTL
eukprot:TRINITY_DN2042_c0_g1_i3.p1 TRINITY_DN2042_c0_g1~~TRINITY_DN2042_c0_g1_i3.p1  ORF type:complete len:398 (-),score=92.80 TRINITY_DN2042_c0_g1_i3:125-1318(-)